MAGLISRCGNKAYRYRRVQIAYLSYRDRAKGCFVDGN